MSKEQKIALATADFFFHPEVFDPLNQTSLALRQTLKNLYTTQAPHMILQKVLERPLFQVAEFLPFCNEKVGPYTLDHLINKLEGYRDQGFPNTIKIFKTLSITDKMSRMDEYFNAGMPKLDSPKRRLDYNSPFIKEKEAQQAMGLIAGAIQHSEQFVLSGSQVNLITSICVPPYQLSNFPPITPNQTGIDGGVIAEQVRGILGSQLKLSQEEAQKFKDLYDTLRITFDDLTVVSETERKDGQRERHELQRRIDSLQDRDNREANAARFRAHDAEAETARTKERPDAAVEAVNKSASERITAAEDHSRSAERDAEAAQEVACAAQEERQNVENDAKNAREMAEAAIASKNNTEKINEAMRQWANERLALAGTRTEIAEEGFEVVHKIIQTATQSADLAANTAALAVNEASQVITTLKNLYCEFRMSCHVGPVDMTTASNWGADTMTALELIRYGTSATSNSHDMNTPAMSEDFSSLDQDSLEILYGSGESDVQQDEE